MDLSFFPCRKNMLKVMQQWMVLNRQEVPLGLCNCCAYKVFGCTMAHQCQSCHVRDGILRLIRKEQGGPVEGEELLGVC